MDDSKYAVSLICDLSQVSGVSLSEQEITRDRAEDKAGDLFEALKEPKRVRLETGRALGKSVRADLLKDWIVMIKRAADMPKLFQVTDALISRPLPTHWRIAALITTRRICAAELLLER